MSHLKIAEKAIRDASDELRALSLAIHSRPELAEEEVFAHDTLCAFFKKHGFTVEEHFHAPTAFRATYGSGAPVVSFMCEYDALPGIGHACGHNLIGASGAAAAIGAAAALAKAGKGASGTVVAMGCYAEEALGGKAILIEKGAFDNIDLAMMIHPAPQDFDIAYMSVLAMQGLTATFHGVNAHAAGFPHEGKNALDAAVAAYTNVSHLRQQMLPTDRVHGVFTDGGEKPNIIPDRAELFYYVRSHDAERLNELLRVVEDCFKAGALAAQCTVDIKYVDNAYFDLRNSDALAVEYTKHLKAQGITLPSKAEQLAKPTGSTDMGNVSYWCPSLHPCFSIALDGKDDTQAGNHTKGFTAKAASKTSHEAMMKSAIAMCLTGTQALFDNGELVKRAKEEFEASGGRKKIGSDKVVFHTDNGAGAKRKRAADE